MSHRSATLSSIGKGLAAAGLLLLGAQAQSQPIQSSEAEFQRVEAVGRAALAAGRYGEALLIARDAYTFARREFGPDHLLTLRALNDVAVVHQMQGEFAAALPLTLQAVGGLERQAGPDHAETVNALANLAQLYVALHRASEAEPLLRRVYATRERTLGLDNEATLQSLLELAIFLNGQHRLPEIATQLQRGAETARRALGADSDPARDLAEAAAAARGAPRPTRTGA